MKKILVILLGLLCLSEVRAVSNPIGFVKYSLLGNSDTRVGLPLHRRPVFRGKIGGGSI